MLYYYDVQKYADWAIEIIEQGNESDELYMLAGMDADDSYEFVKKVFSKVSEDLGLQINFTKEELLKRYGLEIINRFVCGELAPQKGLDIIYSIYVESDSKMMLVDVYILDLFYDSNLTDEEEEKVLLTEFKFCKSVFDLNFDSSVRNMYFCEQCQSPAFMKISEMKSRFLRITVSKKQKWVCGNCGADYVHPGDKYEENRWKIIDYYKRKTDKE